jgi:hypothetical protein
MVSEERPLLPSTRDGAGHDTIYDRFTLHQKRWIVFVVSLAALLSSKQFAGTPHDTSQRRDTDVSISVRPSNIRALHPSDSQGF